VLIAYYIIALIYHERALLARSSSADSWLEHFYINMCDLAFNDKSSDCFPALLYEESKIILKCIALYGFFIFW